jgi:DNA polymerase-3 subunit beta
MTLPALRCLLAEATPGTLTLRATDLELGIVTAVTADVTVPGKADIPARLLGEYVAQLPVEPVRLRLDGATRRLQASCGRYVANLATMDPEEFPELPSADGGCALDVDAGRLRDAITRVAFAVARDDSRPIFRTVLFDCGANGITLAAADGFRLARAHLPAAGAPTQQLLVPARAVAEFGRVLAEAEAARLLFKTDARTLHLAVGDTTVLAQLAEGRFPDLEPVIPREWETRVTVETTAFRQAVRVAGLFGANGLSGDARPMALAAASDELRLHAHGDETGDAETALPARVEGTAQTVVLNTRLLADLVDAAASPHLELAWLGATTPVVIRERPTTAATRSATADADDSRDVWVVMPLSVPAVTRASTSSPPAPTASSPPPEQGTPAPRSVAPVASTPPAEPAEGTPGTGNTGQPPASDLPHAA